MEKIAHYQAADQKAFEKCLRRLDASFLEKGDSFFSSYANNPGLLENAFTFLLKEGGRVKSFVSLSNEAIDFLFPKSKKGSKLFDLYDEIGVMEERVILLICFATDPSDVRQGYMGHLFAFLESSFKNVSWLVLLPSSNREASLYLWKHGFREVKQSDTFEGHEGKMMSLYFSKLRRKGLASISF